jgi:hypothetical protein
MIGAKNGTWGELSKSIQIFPFVRAAGQLSFFAKGGAAFNGWRGVSRLILKGNCRIFTKWNRLVSTTFRRGGWGHIRVPTPDGVFGKCVDHFLNDFSLLPIFELWIHWQR